MRVILTFLALCALALGSVGAEGCVPSESEPWASFEYDDDHAVYAFNHLCPIPLDCIGAFWVYAESNGIDGAQRNDEYEDDTCGGQIPADTMVV